MEILEFTTLMIYAYYFFLWTISSFKLWNKIRCVPFHKGLLSASTAKDAIQGLRRDSHSHRKYSQASYSEVRALIWTVDLTVRH